MAASINQTLNQSQAASVTRLVTGLIFGLAITLCLFWMMQYLIATADRTLNDDGAGIVTIRGNGNNATIAFNSCSGSQPHYELTFVDGLLTSSSTTLQLGECNGSGSP